MIGGFVGHARVDHFGEAFGVGVAEHGDYAVAADSDHAVGEGVVA